MKTLFLMVIVLGIIILRLNIPDNNAGQDFVPAHSGGMVEQMAGRVLLSDAVADWQYQDFLLVKFACSENLKLKLIAVPFQKWKEHQRNVDSCGL